MKPSVIVCKAVLACSLFNHKFMQAHSDCAVPVHHVHLDINFL